MTDQKPTAAAVRAAREIDLAITSASGKAVDLSHVHDYLAAIIERETLCGEMAEALRDASAALEGIYNLIQQQVDEKIRGDRQNFNWSAIITTINDQAQAAHIAAQAVIEKCK